MISECLEFQNFLDAEHGYERGDTSISELQATMKVSGP